MMCCGCALTTSLAVRYEVANVRGPIMSKPVDIITSSVDALGDPLAAESIASWTRGK
jgi:hypothetical protein